MKTISSNKQIMSLSEVNNLIQQTPALSLTNKALFPVTQARKTNIRLTPLFMVIVLFVSALWSIYPNIAHAEGNVSQFDINDVIVEQSADGTIRTQDVDVDPDGNRYVLGNFEGSVLFGEGTQELVGTKGDVFVAKYDANNNLVWVQKFDVFVDIVLPGSQPTGVKFDAKFGGNIYIAGSFLGRMNIGSESMISGNDADGFVAQLNSVTGEVKWANQISGNNQTPGNNFVEVGDLSADGNLVVTGSFKGIAEFGGQSGSREALLGLSPGDTDMYTVLYAFDGSISFVLQAGGDGAEGTSVTLNSGGAITVAGDFFGNIRFPDRTGQQVEELTSAGNADGFVVSYTRSGQRRFVKQISSPESVSIRQVTHKAFEIYIAGNFKDQVTIGPRTLISRGERDIFIAQLGFFGNGSLEDVIQVGGSESDVIHSIDADSINKSAGTLFIAGEFDSQTLTMGSGSIAITIDKPIDNVFNTTFLAGITTAQGKMEPSFGQAVDGKFFSRGLTTDANGTNLFFPGGNKTAVIFGEGNRRIEIPAPRNRNGSGMVVAHFTPATGDDDNDDNQKVFYASSSSNGTVDGIKFKDEDVLLFSVARKRWAMVIDGSDIGLGPVDIDAFHLNSDGTMLLSINKAISLPVVGEVDDSDILLFRPEQLGADTSGSLEIFLRGADAGLTTNGGDIDAIAIDTEGRLVISTLGSANVPGANGTLSVKDEDLLVRNGDVWELLFDGSDIGLNNSQEDIKGVDVDFNQFVITTLGLYEISSLVGAADDMINCDVLSTGNNTQVNECTILFDSGANGMANESIDAISIDRSGIESTVPLNR
ncbi:MAG: hypothetical protein V3U88_01600 [Methylococcales bacterium]